MNSSFPNRWSFSYLKFTKYVTNIIAKPNTPSSATPWSIWSTTRFDRLSAWLQSTTKLRNTAGNPLPLEWESLESRRVKIQLTLLFKVVSDLMDMLASAYLTPASTRTRANHTKKLRQISSKLDAFKYSFFPRTIPVWNSLPATVAEVPD